MKAICPQCGYKFERDILNFDPDDLMVKYIKNYINNLNNKFKENNPCPKCGSHNVDVDLGTQIWCKDCDYKWD